ncbi:MAG: ferrochelatase [Gammaproteobacteria bacterium]
MLKYTGNRAYRHGTAPCTGILITNLGTPEDPSPPTVRRYLAEFLSDARVIELPKPIWWLILHGFILRFRPRRAAAAYRKIWADTGSPLLDIAKKQAAAIQNLLTHRCPGPVQVTLAMRYGNPSIASALEKLRQANARRLLVLPLYPQYSATTTASTFDAVTSVLKNWRWLPELRMVSHYHDDPGHIDALAESIRAHWAQQDRADKLLYSFHGLPKRYFLAGDPYYCECRKTARLVAERLGVDDDSWEVSFQSRFGLQEWLKPYTDRLLIEWAKSGITSVDVICPGFSADCLETLEEINLQNRKRFLAAGGKRFSYIPALNDQPAHITALTDLIIKHCQGWPGFSGDWDENRMKDELQQSAERAHQVKNKT